MNTEFFDLINKYDNITIFRHVNPDFDALGSQFGLACFIKDNFINKNVYCLGFDSRNDKIHPLSDIVADEIIKSSLAIVTDVSSSNRIDDQRFLSADKIVRIDHHPQDTDYEILSIVDDVASSTCEIIVELIKDSNYEITTNCASYLYRGILSDNQNFKTNNTTAKSLALASHIASFNVDLKKVNSDIYDISQKQFEISNYIRTNAVIQESGLVFLVVSYQELIKFNLNKGQIKNQVYHFNGVKEFNIWGIFIEDENGIYEGSLRSKSLQINDIAELYNGGGHKNACGVRDLTKKDLNDLLGKLNERLGSKNAK